MNKDLASERIQKGIDEMSCGLFSAIDPTDITPASKFLFDTLVTALKQDINNHKLMESQAKKIY